MFKKLKNFMSTNQEKDQLEEQLSEEQVADDQQTESENQVVEDQSVSAEIDLAGISKERDELRDKYLRLLAEFDNFKKRNIRERMDLLSTAAKDTMTALLPAIDDFDRLQNLSQEQKSGPAFLEGINLVYHKLLNSLKQKGLEPMETNGQDFDPELHEALTEVPAPTEELKGKIVDTIERGYTLKGKIIRHAKVVTGK
jgi:molecular chaperone GrpE